VPIDHLELVQNGVVVRSLRLTGDRMSADFEGTLALEGTGWVLLRAWNDDANVYVLDAYPYATTNPVFYAAAGSVIHCGPDSDYLVKWIDRLEAAAQAHDGYNTAAEKDATLAEIRAARAKMLERR
jgi:hypothetical protein